MTFLKTSPSESEHSQTLWHLSFILEEEGSTFNLRLDKKEEWKEQRASQTNRTNRSCGLLLTSGEMLLFLFLGFLFFCTLLELKLQVPIALFSVIPFHDSDFPRSKLRRVTWRERRCDILITRWNLSIKQNTHCQVENNNSS